MPIVQITLAAGREDHIVQECLRGVARTVSRTLNAPLSTVRVFVNNVPPQFFAVGDVPKAEASRAPKPENDTQK